MAGILDLHGIRYLRQKPQLVVSLAVGVGVIVACTLLTRMSPITNALIGWNSFTLLYIAWGLRVMLSATRETLKNHAHLYDDGEGMILLLSLLAAILSFVAIVGELATTKGLPTELKTLHVALSGLTLLTSWTFIHVAFAFHYAHGYYAELPRNNGKPCLIFPGEKAPYYTDFLYFSFVIGTSGQTADVDFATMEMRRVGLLHCVAAYLFNATVLALTINIAASLIS
ncbi:hypothetical protein AEAC466_11300 [Asticcacaulis sp. AC466]|uniref:DUF1345 domain-containing protein n=1 Tax=Asticcacaulis sp. AC466 TaxID=1282362 RepID=UPI0003C3B613|nr:DUF1345 domain-containing protein [Asticcacaulis sp. AC466]ESQ83907.1 hypothetical protein AEAC466_11300 [Asticcacaulis sp. AC466]